MHSKMCSTGRPVDEISEFLLFTVTDGSHLVFYALENSARLFKRGVGAYFFLNTSSYPKQLSNVTCRRLVTESLFWTLLFFLLDLKGYSWTVLPLTVSGPGATQGTVLGSILFLIYINDLPDEVVNSMVRLFADYCIIYHQI